MWSGARSCWLSGCRWLRRSALNKKNCEPAPRPICSRLCGAKVLYTNHVICVCRLTRCRSDQLHWCWVLWTCAPCPCRMEVAQEAIFELQEQQAASRDREQLLQHEVCSTAWRCIILLCVCVCVRVCV
jgi:hypothetical protein